MNQHINTIEKIGNAPLAFATLMAIRIYQEKTISSLICEGCVKELNLEQYGWVKNKISPLQHEEWETVGKEDSGDGETKCIRCGGTHDIRNSYKIEHGLSSGNFDGTRSILALGEGGSGKTYTLKRIWDAMGYNITAEQLRTDNKQIMFKSTTDTALEKIQKLGQVSGYPVFMDELDISTKNDLCLFKQVASGEVRRGTRAGEVAYKFSGFIMSATNGVDAKKKDLYHLDAMVQRFYCVRVDPPKNGIFPQEQPLSWDDIKFVSIVHNPYGTPQVDVEELKIIQEFWREKRRESFSEDGLVRQYNDYVDCFRFGKLMGMDILSDNKARYFLKRMADAIVTINLSKVSVFEPIEKAVMKTLEVGDCSEAQLLVEMAKRGFTNPTKCKNIVYNLQNKSYVFGYMLGGKTYYTLRAPLVSDNSIPAHTKGCAAR